MAEYLVTGIAQTSDPQQLEHTLLDKCKCEPERLAIITKVRRAAHDESALRFIHAAEGGGVRGAGGKSMTSTIMSGSSTGTGVPGIGGSNASLSSYSGGSNVPNYLGDLPVPHDAAGNYNIAIDEGRSVVTYKATEDEAAEIEQGFRACGLRNVKVFKPKITAV